MQMVLRLNQDEWLVLMHGVNLNNLILIEPAASIASHDPMQLHDLLQSPRLTIESTGDTGPEYFIGFDRSDNTDAATDDDQLLRESLAKIALNAADIVIADIAVRGFRW